MSENRPSYMIFSYSSDPISPSSQTIKGPSLSPVKHAHIITLTCALLNVFSEMGGEHVLLVTRLTGPSRGERARLYARRTSDEMSEIDIVAACDERVGATRSSP